ncbi:MAG TPA: alkaline phosphatase family protein [Polyangia bacterium]|nr:alkaline phosphatase family protein [Polyangia bacterium]
MPLAPLAALALAFALGGCVAGEPRANLDEREAAEARDACSFSAGARAGATLSRDAPLGEAIPIDHVIVLMLQGRAFDHVLGALPGADCAPEGAANPDAAGQSIARRRLTRACLADPPHSWNAHHVAWGGGRNDGFVRAAAAPSAMGYYAPDDLPGLYSIASQFAVADGYYSSVLGPPSANRAFLYAATAFGAVGDEPPAGDRPTIFSALEAAGVSWAVFSESSSPAAALSAALAPARFHPYRDFVNAAAGGNLPQVSFLEPDFAGADGVRDDFDAIADVQLGDQFLVHLVAAVTRSPAWPRTALFITFSDDGGFYDHAPPPAACAPDSLAPVLAPTDAPGAFDRLGFRVPLIAVSPWARRAFVDHTRYDHTSLVRFLEARFRLPALTARDANAAPPFALFDFTRPRLDAPPLAELPLDGSAYKHCDPDDPE